MIFRIGLDEKPDAWNRAIERAIANECESKVHHACTEYAPDLGWESIFVVKSNTSDRRYMVQLVVEGDERTATCDCPAGNNGVVCWHAAACALIAGMLTQPQPVEVDEVVSKVEPVEAMKKMPKETAAAELAYVFSGSYRDDLMAGRLA